MTGQPKYNDVMNDVIRRGQHADIQNEVKTQNDAEIQDDLHSRKHSHGKQTTTGNGKDDANIQNDNDQEDPSKAIDSRLMTGQPKYNDVMNDVIRRGQHADIQNEVKTQSDKQLQTSDVHGALTTTKEPESYDVITVGLHKDARHDIREGIMNGSTIEPPGNIQPRDGYLTISGKSILQVAAENGSKPLVHHNSKLLVQGNGSHYSAVMSSKEYMNINDREKAKSRVQYLQDLVPHLLAVFKGEEEAKPATDGVTSDSKAEDLSGPIQEKDLKLILEELENAKVEGEKENGILHGNRQQHDHHHGNHHHHNAERHKHNEDQHQDHQTYKNEDKTVDAHRHLPRHHQAQRNDDERHQPHRNDLHHHHHHDHHQSHRTPISKEGHIDDEKHQPHRNNDERHQPHHNDLDQHRHHDHHQTHRTPNREDKHNDDERHQRHHNDLHHHHHHDHRSNHEHHRSHRTPISEEVRLGTQKRRRDLDQFIQHRQLPDSPTKGTEDAGNNCQIDHHLDESEHNHHKQRRCTRHHVHRHRTRRSGTTVPPANSTGNATTTDDDDDEEEEEDNYQNGRLPIISNGFLQNGQFAGNQQEPGGIQLPVGMLPGQNGMVQGGGQNQVLPGGTFQNGVPIQQPINSIVGQNPVYPRQYMKPNTVKARVPITQQFPDVVPVQQQNQPQYAIPPQVQPLPTTPSPSPLQPASSSAETDGNVPGEGETEALVSKAGIKSAKKSKSPVYILNKPKFYSFRHHSQDAGNEPSENEDSYFSGVSYNNDLKDIKNVIHQFYDDASNERSGQQLLDGIPLAPPQSNGKHGYRWGNRGDRRYPPYGRHRGHRNRPGLVPPHAADKGYRQRWRRRAAPEPKGE
jgi:hypothetical protein